MFVRVVCGWALVASSPLPTRPQQYCEPASLVAFINGFHKCPSKMMINSRSTVCNTFFLATKLFWSSCSIELLVPQHCLHLTSFTYACSQLSFYLTRHGTCTSSFSSDVSEIYLGTPSLSSPTFLMIVPLVSFIVGFYSPVAKGILSSCPSRLFLSVRPLVCLAVFYDM